MIGEISGISTTVAAAVEQQRAAAGELSRQSTVPRQEVETFLKEIHAA